MIGTVLKNTYRVVSPLGQGGMGTVYVAEHRTLPRRFAIKFLSGGAEGQPELLQRFEREAQITSRLGHPNIVEVIDFDRLPDGTPFLVMELLEGQDLAARLRQQGPYAPLNLGPVVRQLCAALAAAHEAGVVHRDLKPQNVFLHRWGGAEVVKVLDFGISKIRQGETRLTADQAVMGTVHYMAPEQARGAADVDRRADLFSLGAICYECLTGHLAFPGATLPEVVHAVCYGPRPSLRRENSQVSPALNAVIQRLLATVADQRFDGVAAAWQELAPALGVEAVTLAAATSAGALRSDTGSSAAVVGGARTLSNQGEGIAPTLASHPGAGSPGNAGTAGTAPSLASQPGTESPGTTGTAGTAPTLVSQPGAGNPRIAFTAGIAPTVASQPGASQAGAAQASVRPPAPQPAAGALPSEQAPDPTQAAVPHRARRRWPVWFVLGLCVLWGGLWTLWRLARRPAGSSSTRSIQSAHPENAAARRPPGQQRTRPTALRIALLGPDCAQGGIDLVASLREADWRTEGVSLLPQDEVDEAWRALPTAGSTRDGMERSLGRRLRATIVVSGRCHGDRLHIRALRVSDGEHVVRRETAHSLDETDRLFVRAAVLLEAEKIRIRREARSPEAAEHLLRALALNRGGYNPTNYGPALANLRAALRLDPEWTRALFDLASALIYAYEHSRDDRLLAEAEQVVSALERQSRSEHAKLGHRILSVFIALFREDLPTAQRECDALTLLAPTKSGVLRSQAMAAFAAGSHAAAELLMRRAVDQAPEVYVFRFNLAAIQLSRGHLAESLEALIPVIKIQDRQHRLRERDPGLLAYYHQQVAAHFLRGIALLGLGRNREALDALDTELRQIGDRMSFFDAAIALGTQIGRVEALRRMREQTRAKQALMSVERLLADRMQASLGRNSELVRSLEHGVTFLPEETLRWLDRWQEPRAAHHAGVKILRAAALHGLGRGREAETVLGDLLVKAEPWQRLAWRAGYERLLALRRIVDANRGAPNAPTREK